MYGTVYTVHCVLPQCVVIATVHCILPQSAATRRGKMIKSSFTNMHHLASRNNLQTRSDAVDTATLSEIESEHFSFLPSCPSAWRWTVCDVLLWYTHSRDIQRICEGSVLKSSIFHQYLQSRGSHHARTGQKIRKPNDGTLVYI